MRSGDDEYALPPGLIDSCFQLVAATIPVQAMTRRRMSRSESIASSSPDAGKDRCGARCPRPSGASGQELHTADVVLFEETRPVVASFEGLHLKRARREGASQKRTGRYVGELYQLPGSHCRDG